MQKGAARAGILGKAREQMSKFPRIPDNFPLLAFIQDVLTRKAYARRLVHCSRSGRNLSESLVAPITMPRIRGLL